MRSVVLRSVRLPVAPHNESMRCGRYRWFSRRRNRDRAIWRPLLRHAWLAVPWGSARDAGECSDDRAVVKRFTLTVESNGRGLPFLIPFVRNPGENPTARSRLAS